jgi:hypothetical protein
LDTDSDSDSDYNSNNSLFEVSEDNSKTQFYVDDSKKKEHLNKEDYK